MAHSIEILLDSDTESAVREQWARLESAGLPSAGRVRAGTNRPHCTIVAGSAIASAADAALAATAGRLPFSLRISGAVVFPAGRRFTLARAVVPSSELLSTHAALIRLVGDQVTDRAAHCLPGQWTPHVTLGRRLTATELAAALDLLTWETLVGRATDLRRWDGDTKTDVVVAGRDR
ncbi:2'-5' RNA ligase family protein [Gordonia hydrophobica]|uniref:2'-5' RNA ligase family protein n=1 Tax=Gordonia hydrophobica TaxID=40516 RepID=A0ABZ2TYR7_9ACTN|nr:2'-5' RNA ligase family protein [Gordonia hydrophobica]MBM7367202.1 2'-5' RNA ligase [Gordonia hydrophobica]